MDRAAGWAMLFAAASCRGRKYSRAIRSSAAVSMAWLSTITPPIRGRRH
jgi:hypothetical protein